MLISDCQHGEPERERALGEEIEWFAGEQLALPMLRSVSLGLRHIWISKMARETNTAVNRFAIKPITRVTAKPRTGPVPKMKRNALATTVVTCVSMIVTNARSKPGRSPPRRLSRPHLLLDALEDQHVRIHRHADRKHQTRDAGQGPGGVDIAERRDRDDRVEEQCQHGIQAGAAVVQRSSMRRPSAKPTMPAVTPRRIESAPSDGPTVRSSMTRTPAGSDPARRLSAKSAASCIRRSRDPA